MGTCRQYGRKHESREGKMNDENNRRISYVTRPWTTLTLSSLLSFSFSHHPFVKSLIRAGIEFRLVTKDTGKSDYKNACHQCTAGTRSSEATVCALPMSVLQPRTVQAKPRDRRAITGATATAAAGDVHRACPFFRIWKSPLISRALR